MDPSSRRVNFCPYSYIQYSAPSMTFFNRNTWRSFLAIKFGLISCRPESVYQTVYLFASPLFKVKVDKF